MKDEPQMNDAKHADGRSELSAELGAITLGNKRFVEASPRGNESPNYACEGCAFLHHSQFCALAINRLAMVAFGGDCDAHDVIYVEAPNANITGG